MERNDQMWETWQNTSKESTLLEGNIRLVSPVFPSLSTETTQGLTAVLAYGILQN